MMHYLSLNTAAKASSADINTWEASGHELRPLFACGLRDSNTKKGM